MSTIDPTQHTRHPSPTASPDGAADQPPSDPKLRAQVDAILSQSVADRLRQIEAEAQFFASIRAID